MSRVRCIDDVVCRLFDVKYFSQKESCKKLFDRPCRPCRLSRLSGTGPLSSSEVHTASSPQDMDSALPIDWNTIYRPCHFGEALSSCAETL